MRDALAEIQSGRTVRVDCAPVDWTPHGLQQTNTRVQRRMDEDLAKHELWALVAAEGVITRDKPDWIRQRSDPRVVAWVSIEALGLAWPLYVGRHAGSLEVATCLPSRRGGSCGASVRVLTGTTQRERG